MIDRVHQHVAVSRAGKVDKTNSFFPYTYIYVIIRILGSGGQSIQKTRRPLCKTDTLCPNFGGSASVVNITDLFTRLKFSEPCGL